MGSKILKFGSYDSDMPNIKPAKNFIPQWYKDIKSFGKGNLTFSSDNRPIKNAKSCIPFLDSFTTGYMVELWCDVHFEEEEDGSHFIRWGSATPMPINIRNSDFDPIPVPLGCEPTHYTWNLPYAIQTPPGYSLLVTHPNNRFDLPFVTLTGVVDADTVFGNGNSPFFIKKGFTGIIEKGTPIMQLIPFKREDWSSKEDKTILEKLNKHKTASSRMFFGYYKKNQWIKKKFE